MHLVMIVVDTVLWDVPLLESVLMSDAIALSACSRVVGSTCQPSQIVRRREAP
jgi:hypothetical protein